MSAYQAFTALRASEPDPASLVSALRALDPTAGVQHTPGSGYVVKKATAWTAPQIAAAQTVLDTSPAQDDAAIEIDLKVLKAVAQALWECIPAPSLTKLQLRARALVIWRAL